VGDVIKAHSMVIINSPGIIHRSTSKEECMSMYVCIGSLGHGITVIIEILEMFIMEM
jgi:hypothetical protein